MHAGAVRQALQACLCMGFSASQFLMWTRRVQALPWCTPQPHTTQHTSGNQILQPAGCMNGVTCFQASSTPRIRPSLKSHAPPTIRMPACSKRPSKACPALLKHSDRTTPRNCPQKKWGMSAHKRNSRSCKQVAEDELLQACQRSATLKADEAACLTFNCHMLES